MKYSARIIGLVEKLDDAALGEEDPEQESLSLSESVFLRLFLFGCLLRLSPLPHLCSSLELYCFCVIGSDFFAYMSQLLTVLAVINKLIFMTALTAVTFSL